MASAGYNQQQLVVVPEQHAAPVQYVEQGYEPGVVYGGDYEQGIQIDGGKGSNGAELASLAQSSAIQAKNAVRSQHTAGSQAAYGIKSSLATAALGVRYNS